MSGKYLIGISLNSGKLCENSAKKQIEKKWISKWWDPDALGSQLCCYRKIQRIGMVGLSSFHHWMKKLISFSDSWKYKTFLKNWDSKAPSVGTLLVFFKIESWNFQHQFENNFLQLHKVSTHSVLQYLDNFYFHFFYSLSDWVEILWGFIKYIF